MKDPAAFQEDLSEQDPLGNLLGQSPLPEPDAWFTARTVVRCRHERQTRSWTLPSRQLLARWILAGGLACSLLVAAGLKIHRVEKHQHQAVQEAFQAIASLQNNSDPAWQENTF